MSIAPMPAASIAIKQVDPSLYPPGLAPFVQYLQDALGDLWDSMIAGELTPDEWYAAMMDEMARSYTAAHMAGSGSPNLSPQATQDVSYYVGNQARFLSNFKFDIQSTGEFLAGWRERSLSYAAGIAAPYWRGATRMLPLPAMPGDGTTQCMTNCRCKWDIETLNEAAGDYDCYWMLGVADHCQTCIERAALWNPLRIRDGQIQLAYASPSMAKDYREAFLHIIKKHKHLVGQHNQHTHGFRGQTAGTKKLEEFATQIQDRLGTNAEVWFCKAIYAETQPGAQAEGSYDPKYDQINVVKDANRKENLDAIGTNFASTVSMGTRAVIVHELLHSFDRQTSLERDAPSEAGKYSSTATIGKYSRWEAQNLFFKAKEMLTEGNHKGFVSRYANTTRAEWFAETGTVYLLNPGWLKANYPEAHAYFAKIIDHIEAKETRNEQRTISDPETIIGLVEIAVDGEYQWIPEQQVTTLKHLGGRHNQKRHGWRYSESGMMGYLSKPYDPLSGDGNERTEYMGRYNARLARLRHPTRGSAGVPVPFYKTRSGTLFVAARDIDRREIYMTGSDAGAAEGAILKGPHGTTFDPGVTDWEADAWLQKNPASEEIMSYLSETSAEYKAHVAETLAADTGLSESTVSDFIQTWARSSNDNNYQALLTQQVIAEEFGGELSPWQKERFDRATAMREADLRKLHDDPMASWSDETRLRGPFRSSAGQLSNTVYNKYGTEKEATRALVRAQYKRTQEQLKAAGITHVIVYRGVKVPKDKYGHLQPGDTADLSLNPLESWSLEFRTAYNFANVWDPESLAIVVGMQVPVSRIFSTPKTGFGCLNEYEFTVLNGNDQAMVVVRK